MSITDAIIWEDKKKITSGQNLILKMILWTN